MDSRCWSRKVKITDIHSHYSACTKAAISKRYRVNTFFINDYKTTYYMYRNTSLACVNGGQQLQTSSSQCTCKSALHYTETHVACVGTFFLHHMPVDASLGLEAVISATTCVWIVPNSFTAPTLIRRICILS